MDETRKLFRERLISAEGCDPASRDRYEKEVKMLLEHALGGRQKAMWYGSLVLGIVLGLVFAAAAILSPAELPLLARLGFVLGAAYGLGWAALALSIIRRGTFRPLKDSPAMAGMTWAFVVFMVTLFLLIAGDLPDKLRGIQMVVFGLVFLVGAAVFLINSRIEGAELRTRQKLLEIEIRLAEIEEEQKKKG